MPDGVREWLKQLGLGQYAETFEINEIATDQLSSLSDDELRVLGVAALGHRKRIRDSAARDFPTAAGLVTDPPADAVAPSLVQQPEHRQLTILFCDLVGSVELGERLDLEDYRELLTQFRGAVTAVIEEHQGFIARHQGDGLLAYFGYPKAHEDDAERAVRAGWKIVEAARTIVAPVKVRMQVRVGIATGPSLVGDVLATGASEHSELAALGSTPNLAARLQQAARPDSVVISETTHALTRGLFNFRLLPLLTLKGFSSPVRAYEVASETRGELRFVARVTGKQLTPFVGRARNLQHLRSRWSRVTSSLGQVVLITGQAGIGKSRLLQEFRQHVCAETNQVALLQCAPYHDNSILYPVVAALERRARLREEDTVDGRFARVRAEFGHLDDGDETTLGLLAQMLGIPFDPHVPQLHRLTPPQRREALLRALVDLVVADARNAPVLLAFEDVHWADPTTLELLARLVDSVEAVPVMIVATSRPGFDAPWIDAAHVRVMSLSHLPSEDSRKLAQAAVVSGSLSDDMLETVLSRAGGNPLYIEELARNAALRGDASAIPESLQDSLAAALDASSEGKAVAQVAAVIVPTAQTCREIAIACLEAQQARTTTKRAEVIR